MKIFTNKYFILGNLFLILAAIPVTLFFVKQQQNDSSKAAPSSKLYFTPDSITSSTSCSTFTADVMLDPGTNLVSIVTLYLTYDPTKVEITEIKPNEPFAYAVGELPVLNSGQASVSLDAASTNVSNAISGHVVKVATITFVPKGVGATQIQFDTTADKTLVLSLEKPGDPSVSVLSSSLPADVNINSDACSNGTSTITPGVTNPITNPSTAPVLPTNPVIPPLTTTPSASTSPTLIPTILPTAIPTLIPTVIPTAIPTAIPTPQPTIANTGTLTQTAGIIAAVLFTILGGFALLAL